MKVCEAVALPVLSSVLEPISPAPSMNLTEPVATSTGLDALTLAGPPVPIGAPAAGLAGAEAGAPCVMVAVSNTGLPAVAGFASAVTLTVVTPAPALADGVLAMT